MRRPIGLVLLLVTVAALTGACKRERDQKIDVGKFIDKTEQQARKFVYIDATKQGQTQVAGVVEDDFRYKTRLTMNGRAVEDEIVSDDALAVRFLAPDKLPQFLSTQGQINATVPAAAGGAPPGSTPTSGGVPPVVALQAQRWVVDATGAPALSASVNDRRKLGDDPDFDALTALEYVRRATNAAILVKKYKKDDIEPVFKAKEDPFPKPATGSKTVRYDLKPPPLPKADARGNTGNQTVPGQPNFRKMVVYVRDGVIVEVREQIDVASKLNDLIRLFNLPRDTTVDAAVFAINAVRGGQGDDLIRLRSMRIQFQDLGGALKVELPTDAIAGSLSVLKYRGHQSVTGATTPAPQA